MHHSKTSEKHKNKQPERHIISKGTMMRLMIDLTEIIKAQRQCKTMQGYLQKTNIRDVGSVPGV